MGQKQTANNSPVATTDVAIRDVKSAIDFILQRRSVSKIYLMGWSWGTVIMAAYAVDHPDKVERLVLYGPTWFAPHRRRRERAIR
jgi:pimeloyl-ACP methyl ester carboxylesterase